MTICTLSLLAFFDVGDEVAIMTPYYPAYINTLKALGLKITLIKGSVNNGFQPTLKLLKEINTDYKGLVIASPANPTGSIIDKDEMILIANWCKEKNIRIISDEIYHGIEFETKSDTMFKYNNNSIVINSFSKYFNMTGWRLGWIVASDDLIETIEKLSMALFLCQSNLAQKLSLKVIELSIELVKYGNSNSVTDSGVAAEVGLAGVRGGCMNVLINISGSKNREHKKLKKEIDSIIKKACVLHKKAFNDTKKMIN